jgi:hypothetical protein
MTDARSCRVGLLELLFDDGDLAAWKTRKTTEELRALLKRP